MAKGIIYLMRTVVPGLIKIGKTGSESFNSRMYQLERHGYSNVVGLEREYAIKVETMMRKKSCWMISLAKAKYQILNCLP